MTDFWTKLQPTELWKDFYQVSQIPRGSGNEKEIQQFIEKNAGDLRLEAMKDSAGNLVVKKPAFKGYENRDTIVFQCHVDMVCEKNRGTTHDFSKDPIHIVKAGDWLKAEGTTLGADNGIAVAAALTLMKDSSIKHGPMEFLFTVEEETGLIGAANLDPSLISGRILLNMDSEEEGEFCIGCAGGKIAAGFIPVHWQEVPKGYVPIQILLSGFRGGHSGVDIHRGYGNAVSLGSRMLWNLFHKVVFFISALEGGDKHNAIPREFSANIAVEHSALQDVRSFVKNYEELLKEELGEVEPSLKVEVNVLQEIPKQVLTSDKAAKVLNILYGLPHGVINYSRRVPGLVETSTNLAAAILTNRDLKVMTSQRSSLQSRRDEIADKVKSHFFLAGGAYEIETEYPAWSPEPDSPLVNKFKEAYKTMTGKDPKVKVVHAGLECGVIGSKIPGMSMISFGPDIEGVHTPDERIHIDSTKRTWDLLLYILENI